MGLLNVALCVDLQTDAKCLGYTTRNIFILFEFERYKSPYEKNKQIGTKKMKTITQTRV